MRDDEGLGWKEITAEWCKLTGVTTPVGMSTLRMRYQTMKANFVGFTADDVCIYLLFFLFFLLSCDFCLERLFNEEHVNCWLGRSAG